MQTDRGTAGAYLERLLDRKGWNGATLASNADVPASSISLLLAGTTTITVDTARKLATALDVPVREFVVKVGLFTAEEMDAPVRADVPIAELADDELLAEVRRRMKANAAQRPPTAAEIEADPERFVVVAPDKKDHREPRRSRRRPS